VRSVQQERRDVSGGVSTQETEVGARTGNAPDWRPDASSSMKYRKRIMAVIPKPFGNASYQLVDHGVVVGLILRTPEVLWGVYDLNRNRIGHLSFDAPEQAAAHFEAFRSAS
jgi:hypothetical protein